MRVRGRRVRPPRGSWAPAAAFADVLVDTSSPPRDSSATRAIRPSVIAPTASARRRLMVPRIARRLRLALDLRRAAAVAAHRAHALWRRERSVIRSRIRYRPPQPVAEDPRGLLARVE